MKKTIPILLIITLSLLSISAFAELSDYSDNFSTLNLTYWNVSQQPPDGNVNISNGKLYINSTNSSLGNILVITSQILQPSSFNVSVELNLSSCSATNDFGCQIGVGIFDSNAYTFQPYCSITNSSSIGMLLIGKNESEGFPIESVNITKLFGNFSFKYNNVTNKIDCSFNEESITINVTFAIENRSIGLFNNFYTLDENEAIGISEGYFDNFNIKFPVYTAPVNTPPPTPNITSPYNGQKIYGLSSEVTWTQVTDPQGDNITYIIRGYEIIGGSGITIYNGSSLSTTSRSDRYGSFYITSRACDISNCSEESGYIQITLNEEIISIIPLAIIAGIAITAYGIFIGGVSISGLIITVIGILIAIVAILQFH